MSNTPNTVPGSATIIPSVIASTPVPSPDTSCIQSQDLTPEQVRQWEDTLTHMGWVAPGFRHLFYKLLSQNNKAGQAPHVAVMTKDVPIAATDGDNVLINPETFFKFGLAQRTFILAHEVVHNVFDDISLLRRCTALGKVPMHDGTTMPFDEPSMQKAMDLRINALLAESRTGTMPDVGWLDQTIATGQDSVLDVYKKVYEDNGGTSGNPGGFDQVAPGAGSTGQGPSQKNQQQWAVEVAVAQTLEQMNRDQGKLPGALQRMFKDILEPEIPWTEHIKGIVNRAVGSGNRDWRRPDRRFIGRDIYLPSPSGFGAGWLVLWGDTSGSIGQKELCSYMAELEAIIEDVKPKRLTILWCDSAISFVDECESAADLHAVKCRGVGGGGGTSVKPVFDWIHDNAHELPDMFIGLTDCCVTFPTNEPPCPMIWACVDKDGKAPYGEMVYINQRKP